ncbi:MAG: hypothetical protein WC344_04395 [Bacilli bacterium]|jgi:hypothetical protein
MKRLRFIIAISILPLALLAGCDGNANKTPLIYGALDGELKTITYDDFSHKVAAQQNFLVFSLPNSNCTCWTTFRDSILKPYLAAYRVEAYAIPYRQFFDDQNNQLDTLGMKINASSQSFGLYKDGVAKVAREYDSSLNIWKSKEAFFEYFEELVIAPTVLSISLTDLESLYEQAASFALVYYDESPESLFLRENMLRDYALANLENTKTLYAVNADVEGIKLNGEGTYQEAQWQAFKDKYGLSLINNAVFGYADGFVPTFQYIEPDGASTNGEVIKSQAVYLNDSLLAQAMADAYTIESSYYESERLSNLSYLDGFAGTSVLQGLSISTADTAVINSYRIWQYEKAAVYHDPLIAAFLDHHLEMVTHVDE